MSSSGTCKECGAAIPADGPGGFCAPCLLGLGLQDAGSQKPASPRPATENSGDRIGRYRLLEEIGHGGCGVVYMAEQEEPVRRKVALKVIKLGMDTRQVVARFEAERQALALMDHPNIAKVLDAGATETGRPYFVMELVGGVKITDYCQQTNLTTRQRLDLFIQVCRAIQHAHQKGVIHRDIKPSNVLVATQDGMPVPKVIDFGIAKATQGRLTDQTVFTAFEQFLGTPAYMSPEQAQLGSLDVDTRSDIYSLGVLLYELLTGKTPFDSKELLQAGLEAMRRTIQEKEPPTPSTRVKQELAAQRIQSADKSESKDQKSKLATDLDWIVMKCLEKDRARRYETANGLARDIERYLNHEPVVAGPPSGLYRLQKAMRRNKTVYIAGAAVLVALVTGMTVSTWEAVQAQRALVREANERHKAGESAEELRQNLYASETGAAFAAYRAGSIQRSRELLERQNHPSMASRRGFEWRWLWGQTRPTEEFIVPVAGQGPVLSLEKLPPGGRTDVLAADFSPDGRRFLTLDLGSLKLWDTTTHQLIRSNHQEFGYHAAFSPDGRYMVSLNTGGPEVLLWDAPTGRWRTNLVGHTQPVLFATFSHDGRLLASSGASFYSTTDGEVFLWDLASMGRIAVLRAPGTQFIFRLSFSPDATILAAGCGNGHVLLWDVQSRREVGRLVGHRGAVLGVCFAPDGKRLVSVGMDRTVRLWDVDARGETSLLGLHEKAVFNVSVSPDGQCAATVGGDHMVKVWRLDPPGLLRTFRGHEGRTVGVAFHPDSTTLLTSAADSTARFWRVPKSPEDWALEKVSGWSFGFASQRRLLLGLATDDQFSIVDVTTKKTLLHVVGRDPAWLPDSERIVFHRGAQLLELDCSSGSEQLLGPAGETAEGLSSIGFSTDGRWLAWGHGDHAHVFDRASRVEAARLNTGAGGAEHVAFAPRHAILATAGSGSPAIQFWDIATWRPSKSLEGHRTGILAFRFSPDGSQLASTSSDQTTRLWRLPSGDQAGILRDDEGEVLALAYSPDARTLAVGTFEGSIKLWNVAALHQIASFDAGASRVFSVNFSPDGSALGAMTYDGNVRIWRAPLWSEINRSP